MCILYRCLKNILKFLISVFYSSKVLIFKVLFLSSVCLFLLFLIPSHKRLTDWGGGGGDGDKPPSVRE